MGGHDIPSNMQPLCLDCHKLKSAREQALHRGKGDKPEPHATGLDGYPVHEQELSPEPYEPSPYDGTYSED
jgi:hypothetical protein